MAEVLDVGVEEALALILDRFWGYLRELEGWLAAILAARSRA